MGRGDRLTKEDAKGLLYGPRPQGPGPVIPAVSAEEPEQEDSQPVASLPSVPNSVIDARDRLPLDDIKARGVKQIVINYSGYGDSGDIHDIEFLPKGQAQDDEESLLSDFAFELLSANHGGWEINEGSEGSVKLDLDQNSIEHNHYTNYVSQHHDLNEMGLD